jgi:acetyl esterase/lipase
MSIIEAVKGAHADISSLARPIDKLARLGTYIRVLGAEVLGMVTVIPYGLRAFALHRSLPAPPPHHTSSTRTPTTLVSLARAIPYGPGPRNAIDIYLPCGPGMHDMHDDDVDPVKRPVMLFVHGGVWAAGERFHYAPMAVRCAQAGIISAVMSYTLYPEAKVPTMVDEVGAALDWTLENISRYGGDPSRIILVGHSAGAQLSALTLIQRSLSGFTKNNKGMPCAFVGMAGVYNIKEHYQYEKGRF